MDALDGETSIAAGEHALQALLRVVRSSAGQLEAHEAEKGICKRRLPIGLAAMKPSFAQRGTGERGAAVTQAAGMFLPREQPRRGRDYCSRFGTCKGARTGYRTPGEPGSFPLDEAVNLPERGYASCLPEWGCFAPLFDLEVAESVLMEVAKEAPEDDEGF
jgi:hypothetical protein